MNDLTTLCDRDRRWNWTQRGILIAVLLACGVALSPSMADPDLWGHVQYGRDALRDGLPATTTYSFTAEGYRWINHENLAEVIFAIGADTIGPIGLHLFKLALGLGVVGLMLLVARRQGAGFMAMCGLALIVSINLTYHWSVRPQIFTFVYFALMLWLLDWCFTGWQGRWHMPWLRRAARADNRPLAYVAGRLRRLWLAVPLFFLWANTHGGFVAGYCIFAAILTCRAVEAACFHRRNAWGLIRRMALMIAAAGAATLINPYGPGLHQWLLQSLSEPRPEISEWHPIAFSSPHFWPFVVLIVVSLAAIVGSRRSLDFTQLVLLAVTLWQAVSHQRHIPFFALLCGFWLAPHVESLLARLRVGARDRDNVGDDLSPRGKLALGGGLAAAYVLLVATLYDRVRDMPVERDRFPVAAIEYMAEENLTGNLIVTYNWAQYAIAALGPRGEDQPGVRVQLDGRFRTCYPQEVVDMHFDFVLGHYMPHVRHRSPNSPPEIDGRRVLFYKNPDLVLLSRGQPGSAEVMQIEQSRGRWTLLYQDQLAQVWGRSDKFADPASPHFVPPSRRRITNEPQVGSVTWPALPERRRPRPQFVTND